MPRVAVRVRTAAESMALHHALESATLRGAGDLHDLAGCEDVHLHHVADLVFRLGRILGLIVEPEAAQHARRRLESRLLRVTHGRARRTTSARNALVAGVLTSE